MATFTVTCPCCNGRLTIGPAVEAVIAHDDTPRPQSGGVPPSTATSPCSNGRLTIDPALEAVIAPEAPPRPKSGVGLDDALNSLKGAAERRAERFKDELKAQEKKGRALG